MICDLCIFSGLRNTTYSDQTILEVHIREGFTCPTELRKGPHVKGIGKSGVAARQATCGTCRHPLWQHGLPLSTVVAR
jgi:hypothetical protein